jgi:hypothetical protein
MISAKTNAAPITERRKLLCSDMGWFQKRSLRPPRPCGQIRGGSSQMNTSQNRGSLKDENAGVNYASAANWQD